MKLYIVRHGESLDSSNDQTRALTEKGQKEIVNLGRFLSKQKLEINRILHSGKVRTEQTAEILAKELKLKISLETSKDLEPFNTLEPILEQIYSSQNNLLIVGHMPFLGRLVSKLICRNEDYEVLVIKPGCIVSLQQITRERWLIDWFLNPELF